MRHTLHIILALALLLVGCHSDPRQVELIDRAEAVMDSLPETAIALLDSVDSHRLVRADNARYALLRSQALDKNFIDITNDSLINIAVDYYTHSRNNLRYRGMAHYYKARVLYNAGDYEQATEHLIKAEETLLNTTEYNVLALTYNLLSEIYIEQYRLDDAIDLINKSSHYYEMCGNRKNIVYNHLRLSNVLMIEHPADSVLCHLDSAQMIAERLNNEELLFTVENFRASFYDYIKEYDRAKATLYNAFEQYPAHKPNANDYFLMSSIYYNSGQLDSALYILDNYYAPLCQTHSDRETLSLFCSDIYKAMQDYPNAYTHLYNYMYSVTESGLLQQDKSINELEKKYRTELLKQETHSIKSRSKFLTIISTLAILLLLLLIVLQRRQQQMRQLQYEQLHESAQQNIARIQQQYELVKSKLDTESAQKALYNNALKGRIEMLSTLLELTDIYESRQNDFYKKCRSYCDVCGKNEKSFVKDIRDIASIYCNNFVEKLQSRFTTLSDEEINLCCLLLMGFDINHIRILFNHTQIQSTYSKKTRLRKKLGLNGKEDTKEFLLSLCEDEASPEQE